MDKGVITKGARIEKAVVNDDDLALINQHAMVPLESDKIFIFKVALCDNEVDRDFEVFPTASLEALSKLYTGKTIIKNHDWGTDGQVARIYKTEVEQGHGTTKNGENYARLIAYCYMTITDTNKDLISDIQSGIKKEVSVGCRTKKAICSICGTDNREGYCKHWNGREYDGKQCYFKLEEPQDAYEVSFVAVPAQPNAGVTKSYTGEEKIYTDEAEQQNKNEDLINVELGMVKSFIFAEKERED